MNYVQGVDISAGNGVIDWDILKQKVGFLYIRSSDGMGYDSRYTENLQGARKIGVWGNYHNTYCGIAASAAMQGRYHGQREAGMPGNLPPWIDFERTGDLTGVPLKAWLRTYLEEFERACNRRPMLYTRPSILKMLLYYPDWLLEYKLAIANYGAVEPTTYGWPWTFFQYEIHYPGTDYGQYPPYIGGAKIDLDKYRAGYTEFEAEFGVAPNTGAIEPEPEPELPEFVTVSVSRANIRNKPAPEAAYDVGDVLRGKRLPVTGETGDYYQVSLYVHKSVVKR